MSEMHDAHVGEYYADEIKNFFNDLLSKQKRLDPEIGKIISANMREMLEE